MAQMSGRRRRVQIACAALVLVVVEASVGIGQDDSAAASIPTAPSGTAATSGKAQVAAVVSSSDAVRVFQASREAEPAEPDAEDPGDTDTAKPPKDIDPEGKVIYLTFDDGPSASYTKPILDLLDEYGAKATFFQVGENAIAHPELSRSVVARGHALGNHTWNHKDMRKQSPQRLNHGIIRTSNALRRITGQPITCLRPPYGAVNGRVKATVREKELALKLWDIDPRDWKRPGVAAIARRVVSKATPGAVSLMHDGGGNRSQSVRALKRILRTLSEKGYTFKTLPGC